MASKSSEEQTHSNWEGSIEQHSSQSENESIEAHDHYQSHDDETSSDNLNEGEFYGYYLQDQIVNSSTHGETDYGPTGGQYCRTGCLRK